MEPLKGKHEFFCLEYVKCFNATQAYKRVYGTTNDDTACANGARLLANANVKARIASLTQELSSKSVAEAELTIQWVINGLMTEATNFDDGSSAGARVRALELLGKYIGGVFKDQLEVSGKIDHEHSGKVDIDINSPEFNALPVDERIRRMQEAFDAMN